MLRLPVKHVNNVVSPDTFILCAGANIDITILNKEKFGDRYSFEILS